MSNYTRNPKTSYSLETILHKLRPTSPLKFSVQLILAVPSQRQDPKKKKKVSWQYLE